MIKYFIILKYDALNSENTALLEFNFARQHQP